MRRKQLTETITQVTRLRIVNAYLVREDDGLTLVDTMIGGSAKGLLREAAALGTPIHRIALTHGHGDHVGSLDALRDALGDDVEVLVPARDARILEGDTAPDAGEPGGELKGSWPSVATVPDVRLQPGDRVGSLEVVASPGHTPGHVAFLDLRDRALICGDALHTAGGTTVAGMRNRRFPLVAMATWNSALALQSACALSSLASTLLAPGHGRALHNPQAEIDGAIAQATAAMGREQSAPARA